MKTFLLTFAISLTFFSAPAQNYSQQIAEHRQHYKNEFITDKNSPLKADDIKYLNFFDADENFKATAKVVLTPNEQPFDLPTYSGKTKKYIKYAELHFEIKNQKLKLSVYQSLKLMNDSAYKNHLFVPFKDETSGIEAYGGGRYIDLSIADIKDNTIEIDFNKCYNPYCAYSSGYSCPIPPDENNLKIKIEAGEKNFGKPEH